MSKLTESQTAAGISFRNYNIIISIKITTKYKIIRFAAYKWHPVQSVSSILLTRVLKLRKFFLSHRLQNQADSEY